MLAQQIYALARGCDGLNDHEQIRHDPPLAGKSTLNRVDLAPAANSLPERHPKIRYSDEATAESPVTPFLEW